MKIRRVILSVLLGASMAIGTSAPVASAAVPQNPGYAALPQNLGSAALPQNLAPNPCWGFVHLNDGRFFSEWCGPYYTRYVYVTYHCFWGTWHNTVSVYIWGGTSVSLPESPRCNLGVDSFHEVYWS